MGDSEEARNMLWGELDRDLLLWGISSPAFQRRLTRTNRVPYAPQIFQKTHRPK